MDPPVSPVAPRSRTLCLVMVVLVRTGLRPTRSRHTLDTLSMMGASRGRVEHTQSIRLRKYYSQSATTAGSAQINYGQYLYISPTPGTRNLQGKSCIDGLPKDSTGTICVRLDHYLRRDSTMTERNDYNNWGIQHPHACDSPIIMLCAFCFREMSNEVQMSNCLVKLASTRTVSIRRESRIPMLESRDRLKQPARASRRSKQINR